MKECCHPVLSSGHYSVLRRVAFSSFVFKGWMKGRERGCGFSLNVGPASNLEDGREEGGEDVDSASNLGDG